LKILLSAFACAPNTGSEAGGGWVYAVELARNHEVWVMTDESRRSAIVGFAEPLPLSLRFIYYRPQVLARTPLNSKTAHLIYQAWQMGAWRIARALDAEHDFDVCWHLTYGVFRQPSWMWKVGKPLVFGPVGGGERAPMRLWRSMPFPEQLRELARDVVNTLAWALPGLRATYRNADLVIARTDDTRHVLPAWAQGKTAVQQEIGGYPARVTPDSRPGHNGYLKVLFAGRLLGWKGIHLALRAFAGFLREGGQGDFTIIGEGPMGDTLRGLAARLGIADRVTFVSRLPQDELFRRYADFDVLLFPSLHDSGGNVVIESLSFGLPVICLDLGGPGCFVDESCGVIVPAHEASETEVVAALETALLAIFSEPVRHAALCRAALARAEALTWEKQIQRVVTLIEERLAQ
jgi:glycosyltransferase involved in cell wall biosynthesis